jgi:hypothetical protein
MIVNYKTIIQDLSGIAYYHNQINSFGYGDLTQITMDIETKQEPLYTKMYVVPGSVQFAQNRLLYNFSIIILDQVNDDLSNQEEVMSDTLEICKDVFTILYQSYTANWGGFSIDYTPLWGPNVTPFLERFETVLGGWTMNLTIEQPFDYNICVLPIPGYSIPKPRSYNQINYYQLIEDFKGLAAAHEQINSFGFGDINQLTMDIETKQSPVYTKLYMVPNDTVLAQNQIIYNFQIIVADRLKDDYSNQRDVMNDTLEIMKDVFTFLYLSVPDFESEWDPSVEPFLERFEDVLAGWTMTLTVTQPFDYNRCNVPERPFVNKKWYELAELWNTISTDWKNV